MLFKKKSLLKRLLGFFIPSFSLTGEARRGIFIILLLVLGLVCLFGFLGQAGEFGRLINYYLEIILGQAKWTIPALFFLTLISIARDNANRFDGANIFGLFLFLASASGLFYFFDPIAGGGIIGQTISPRLVNCVGSVVTSIIFISGLLVSLLLILDTSLSRILGQESFIYKIIIFILSILFSPFIKTHADDDDDNLADDEQNNSGEAIVKEYDVEGEDEDGADDEKETGKESERVVYSNLNEKTKKTDGLFGWNKTNLDINIPLDLLKNTSKKPSSM